MAKCTAAHSFVQALVAGDKNKAELAFRAGLSEKAGVALEVRKVTLANEVFNLQVSKQPASK